MIKVVWTNSGEMRISMFSGNVLFNDTLNTFYLLLYPSDMG